MGAASPPPLRAPLTRRRIRLLVSMLAIYSVLLTLAIAVSRMGAPAPLRYAAAALPALPLALLVAGQVRATRDIDDTSARARLEAIVWGIGLGSVLVFAYGLMQFAGAPMLNWAFVWPVYGVTWLVAERFLLRRRASDERLSDRP